MSQIHNKIDKAFILAGGKGNRINLGQKENIKAFIEIDNEQLLKRHIRLINENLKPKTIYIVITKFEKFFKENIEEFNNVELIINDDVSNQKGLELLLAIKNINKIIDKNEKILLTLVDEYYDDSDFINFCSAITNKSFTTMVAIKKLNFPDEYLKNYAVTLDMEKEIVIDSVEKSKKIISDFFGTGLICIDKNFTEHVVKNLEENIKTPLFSLLNKSQISKYHILDNIYSNINTRVDIYELEKKIRKNKKFTIDVIIPAYLEEANISFVVNDFKKVVDNVIIANKISEDKTEIIAKSNGAKVISDNYLGYGHAIRSGIKNSNADIIVLAEADGTFRSSDLEKLLNCLMDNDVVQGTRTNPAYIQYKANMDRPRIFFNKLFGNFISIIWPRNKTLLSDVGCTYRAFWKTKYNKIEKNLTSDSAAFAPELTIEFINKGFRVIEIPVNYHPRNMGVSKLSGTYIRSGVTALKMLKIILQKRFLYLFSK
jgi:UDP-N-acetylglucosamine diphosphorylase / glucose-1-phosphate thymidylyltransferase / UDP-N-acetylgalactosamine diphosphorylase / glucosamine-1-phosphate N-acetyltransferase / galactosamine-1-phosphate N-acetyltransferase